MKNIITSDICKKCAECCRKYPYVELSHDEIYDIEKLTKLPAKIFTNPKDKAGEEHFLAFQENGDCFFLRENSGEYSCGVYAARSKKCRNYPSNQKQNEVCSSNKEMMGLNNSSA